MVPRTGPQSIIFYQMKDIDQVCTWYRLELRAALRNRRDPNVKRLVTAHVLLPPSIRMARLVARELRLALRRLVLR